MQSMILPALCAALFALGVRAQQPAAHERLAETTLQGLDTRQRVAQLIVCWSQSRDADSARVRELRGWVKDPGIGGVILSLGQAETAATILDDLQARANLPLLCAADFENGPGSHLEGTTDLGEQMLWGAAGSTALVEAAAFVTAREARALGFQQVYAPVLDVNSDPRNPVIAVRSYGEDPNAVARLGSAYVRAAEAAGLMTTAKHFPGHGDVSTDSHVSLPIVPGDAERLAAVELPPFRAAIASGLGAVMTGHLAMPGLGLPTDLPATLSPRVLTELLRGELGFDGLIVTDALDMGALFEDESAEDPAIRALRAGADVLLMPRDPRATVAAVVAAVESGKLDAARVDEACRRVLRAKARAGLLSEQPAERAPFDSKLQAPGHLSVALEIAKRGITLVRDPRGLVPLPPSSDVLLVTVTASEDGAFADSLTQRLESPGFHRVTRFAIGPSSTEADGARVVRALEAHAGDASSNRVLLSLIDDRFERMPKNLRAQPASGAVLAALEQAPRHVQVLLGIPYGVGALHLDASLICTYHRTPVIERALTDALLGIGPVSGRLPVTLPEQAPLGAGVTRLPAARCRDLLPRVSPRLEGFAPDLEDRIRKVLREGRANRAFPGAVVQVARRGRLVAEVAIGSETWEDDAAAITSSSLFDLASLTKVCATSAVALRLIDRGALALEQPVHELVPEFADGDKRRVRVRDLLTHTSGLPPFRRLFLEHSGAFAMLRAALAVELEHAPGERYVYSDLGMMVLMLCCERAGGLPFAQLCAREVFEPLGMRTATFAGGPRALEAVPTEVCKWRGQLVRGRVHDENAYAMGGLSGHAGLFATATDVTRLAHAYLGGGRGWLRPATAAAAISAANRAGFEGTPRGLGWGLYPEGLYRDSDGRGGLSERSFGHTGYTGTSLHCDPERDLSIVLLTNRVHPTRDNRGHLAVRRALVRTVRSALVDDLPGR